MSELHFESGATDEERRALLYCGVIFLYQPTDASLAFCEFARKLVAEAFNGLDPETAQHDFPVDEYIDVLKALKPHFIHHPHSKKHIQALLKQLGCDEGETYFDVPRLRTSTSDGYLTSGLAYAWHPHRDTWYSAPPSQINW